MNVYTQQMHMYGYVEGSSKGLETIGALSSAEH